MVVSEYEADALALDSDDEKRLERAERMAEHKVTAKKRKSDDVEKVRKAAREVQERAKASARWDGVEAPLAAKPMLSRPAGPVVCYGCDKAGHFKRDCPKRPSVVYPLVVKDSVRKGGAHVGIQAQGEWGGHGKCLPQK